MLKVEHATVVYFSHANKHHNYYGNTALHLQWLQHVALLVFVKCILKTHLSTELV